MTGVLGEDVDIQSIAHNTILTIFLCLSGCEEFCGLATVFGFYSVMGIEVSSVLKCQKTIQNLCKSPRDSDLG